jgi:hypothetical protein
MAAAAGARNRRRRAGYSHQAMSVSLSVKPPIFPAKLALPVAKSTESNKGHLDLFRFRVPR